MKNKSMNKTTAENLESKFDAGEDVLDYFDLDKITVSHGSQRVPLDMPTWAVKIIDKEANRKSVPRGTLMKLWLIDIVDKLKEKSIP